MKEEGRRKKKKGPSSFILLLPPSFFLPASGGKVTDARTADQDALSPQESTLHGLVPAVAAEPSGSRDDPVTRYAGGRAAAHDAAHCPPRTWSSGHCGDVAVGGYAASRNPPVLQPGPDGRILCRAGSLDCSPCSSSEDWEVTKGANIDVEDGAAESSTSAGRCRPAAVPAGEPRRRWHGTRKPAPGWSGPGGDRGRALSPQSGRTRRRWRYPLRHRGSFRSPDWTRSRCRLRPSARATTRQLVRAAIRRRADRETQRE